MNLNYAFIGGAEMRIKTLETDLKRYEYDLKFANYVMDNQIMGVHFYPPETTIEKINTIKSEIEHYEKQIEQLRKQIEIEEMMKRESE